MGRGCTMDEWVHFEKLPEEGRVPNSSYWYVHCRHCTRGYELKQILNPPTKLTGRRSAMRAHLKICPMYAPQYKLEQRALAVAAASASASAAALEGTENDDGSEDAKLDDGTNQAPKRKRRGENGEVSGPRGGRGKHCMMEEWEHFVRLQDEGYIGKSNFFYAICKYCQQAYDDASEEKKPLMVPERMVGRREKMRKHLTLCPYFKGELPALERRTHLRHAGPTAFLPMATADGIKMVPTNALAAVVPDAAGAVSVAGSPAATTPASAEAIANAAAVVAAATIEATPSSRLALDEWQYFTRLQRKKDSAYYFARCNFCQHAFENAPESLKSSMSPTIVMGRKSNMQTHLAKCPYVPKDATLFGRILPMSARGDDFLLPNAKRAKTSRDADNAVLLEFTLQHRLPFDWVESASAQKLMRLGSEMHAAGLPTSAELRGPVLDGLQQSMLLSDLQQLQATSLLRVNEETVNIPSLVAAKIEASRACDESAIPKLECSLTAGQASVPMEFIRQQRSDDSMDTQDDQDTGIAHFHGLEVARWIEQQLQDATSAVQLAPKIVSVPVNPIFRRAVGILRARYPDLTFLPHFDHLVMFCLRKVFEHPQVVQVVNTVITLGNDERVRPHLKTTAPVVQWTDFCVLMEEIGNELPTEVQAIVDDTLDRALFERVLTLLRAFMAIVVSLRNGSLALAEAVTHLTVAFRAADGFDTVRAALEVAWSQCEQPLFVLASALHPHHRLRTLHASDLTKPSVLSDASVLYFTQWFTHKPASLRGDVTGFSHTSQTVFADAFIAEFPVLDDYYRYLTDNHAELALLMQQLHATTLTSLATREVAGTVPQRVQESWYSEAEAQKLQLLLDRWQIQPSTPAIQTTNVTDVSQDLCAQWVAAIDEQLKQHMVDFTDLEEALLVDAGEDTEDDALSAVELVVVAEALTPLPTQPQDDIEHFPSTPLSGARSKRVRLATLCQPPDQATI